MSKLIENRFGRVGICEDVGEPMFVYTFIDDNGNSDDCEYAFTFKGDKICLYGWHFGHDTTFTYTGNWMDIEAGPEVFHDRDYQDGLVGQLRLCLKDVLNNIVGLTIEYL